jgi:murein DD-endopeptidase MepM/ murein hydrolase activator NlpD
MRFLDLLLAVNDSSLNDFLRWVFRSGMLFDSPNKWWGDRGRRDFPHEGVDFCLYENHAGKTLQIDHQTRIPAIHNGVVRQIFPDYLGQAIVVEHETTQNETTKMISIYAHTKPMDQVHSGVVVKRGDIIATIADTSRSKAPILPHLHYTLGQATADMDYGQFAWNDIRNPDMIVLLNPLSIIEDPYV